MSRTDFIVFHSCEPVHAEACERIREQVGRVLPDMQVLVCGPGDTISMPVDTRRLCDSVDSLQRMVSALVALNQEILSAVLDVQEVETPQTLARSHLGMSSHG